MSNFLRNPWIKNGFQFSLHYPARAQIIQILGNNENNTLKVLLSDSTNIVLAVLSKESLERFRETVATPYSEIKGCFITLEDYLYCYDSNTSQPYIFLKEFRYCGSESPIIGEPLDLIYDSDYKFAKEFKIFQPFSISDICIPKEEIKKQITPHNQQYLKEVFSEFYSDCNFLNENENIGCFLYNDGTEKEKNTNILTENISSRLNEIKEVNTSDSVHDSFSSSCPTDLIVDSMQSENLFTENEQTNSWLLFHQNSYPLQTCIKHFNKSTDNIENYKSKYFNRICNIEDKKDIKNIPEFEEYLIKYEENLFENDIVDGLETTFIDEEYKNSNFYRFEEKNKTKSKNNENNSVTIVNSQRSINTSSSEKYFIRQATEKNIFMSSMKRKENKFQIKLNTKNSIFKQKWRLKRNIKIKIKCSHFKNIERKVESVSEKIEESKNLGLENTVDLAMDSNCRDFVSNSNEEINSENKIVDLALDSTCRDFKRNLNEERNPRNLETKDLALDSYCRDFKINSNKEINPRNLETEFGINENIRKEHRTDLKISMFEKKSEDFNLCLKKLKRKKPFNFDSKEDDYNIKSIRSEDKYEKNNLENLHKNILERGFTGEYRKRNTSRNKNCNEIIRCTNWCSEKTIEIFPRLYYCSEEKQRNDNFGFFSRNNYNKTHESISLRSSKSKFNQRKTRINCDEDYYDAKRHEKVRWSDNFDDINCKVYICTNTGKSVILHNPNHRILEKYIFQQNFKYEIHKPIYIEFYKLSDIKILKSKIFKTFSYPNLNGWAYNYESEVLDFYNFLFQMEFFVRKYFESRKSNVEEGIEINENGMDSSIITSEEGIKYTESIINLQNHEEISMEICSFKRESDYSGSF
ncbi:hypothetical protein CWI36_0108p0040, partial [Hamiltosporidium magnivora]